MFKTNFHPSKKHLSDIQNWLIEEWNKYKSGFYCNWERIKDGFDRNNLAIITVNDYAIGFLVYKINALEAEIQITETKISERKKGVASKLIKDTLDYLKQKDVLACELHCTPKENKLFWKKNGFKNFPDMRSNNSKIRMFKTLVETLDHCKNSEFDIKISLINHTSLKLDGKKRKWYWDVNLKEDNVTLSKPIILPVSWDWQLELIKNGKQIESSKVKRSPFVLQSSFTFMIIQKLNE